MHVIKLNGYNATTENGEKLELGTFDSYGEEELQIVEAPDWVNLNVIATFNPPNKKPVRVTVDSVTGVIKVPKEATADLYGVGTIVFVGLADGVQRISADCEYIVRKHSNASGTEPAEPTPDLLQQVLTLSKDAQTAAKNAEQSAKNAEQSAESAAKDAADTVKPYKEEAVQAATAAALSEKNAAESKAAAQEAAERATQAGIAARASEEQAAASERAAKESADAAAKSAQTALESKTAAATSEVNAAASAKKAQDVADSLPEDYTTAVNDIATLKQQVANITPDDSAIGDKPWSSKHIIDMLCPPLQESGNPVVCYPAAGYSLGVKAKWEPVQEGTGTPYPAGAGKQLLDTNKCVPTVGKPYGMTITLDGDVFKVSGVPNEEVTATEFYSFAVCTCSQEELRGKGYKVTAWAIKGKVNNAWGLRTESEDSLTIAAELTPGVNNDIQLRLMVSKDTPTAWEPYENIRPIKGRDSVRVERCGENLLNPKENAYNTYTPYGLTITYIGDNKVHLSGTYNCEVGGGSFGILDTKQKLLAGRNLKITGFTIEGTKQTYTLYGLRAKDETVIAMNAQFAKGDVIDMTVAIVVSKDTPTTYKPYIGQTNTLTLPETVYGGEVDAVTGDGNNNTKVLTLDGNKLKFSQSNIYFNLPLHSAPGILARGIICCSHINYTRFGVNTNYNFCFALASDITDLFATVDDLNAYLVAQYAAGTPVQIAYKLATPTSFAATGAQPLPALAGANTVLTDADTVEVTGRADPIKRIEDLEAAVASIN